MVTITPLHLKQAGFDDKTIHSWVDNQRGLLKKAGFSEMEINNAYGLRPLNSDGLSAIEENTDNTLLNNTNINKDEVQSTNKKIKTKNTANENNQEIEKKLSDNHTDFDKLITEDKTSIVKMLLDAKSKFDKDEEGKVKFIDNYLSTNFPNISLNEIQSVKNNIENEEKLFTEAQEKVNTKLIDDAEARDILQGNVGFNSATKRFTYSKEYEDLYRDEKIEKKTSSLEKEVRDEKKKLYVLNAPLTTGKESRHVMQFLSNQFGWNEDQVNNWNNFFSYLSAMESDNRNIYSRDGEAKGIFQIRSSSLTTHLRRLVALKTHIDKNYQLEKWIENAFEHRDATALSIDQQKALVMANLYMIKANKRLNRKGTNELIQKIADGDTQAMAELYKNYHHADYEKTIVAGKSLYNVRENKKLDKRIDDHLKHWGSNDVGYTSPKQATWASDSIFDNKLTKKADDFLAYYLGGQGNRNVFKSGYSNSVVGLIDHYNDWAIDNPNATDQDKEDMMKQLFMYGENQAFGDEVVQSAVTLLMDSPIMAAGCFAASAGTTVVTGGLAAPAAPLVCMGAAFAIPEAMRSALMDGMLSGKYKDFSEFWQDFTSAKTGEVATKMFTLGAATGAVGKIAQTTTLNYLNKPFNTAKYNQKWATGSRLTAEIYTMTELGARMEGHVPTLRDFAHTAVLIFGFHATTGQVKNLINIYKNHAVHPKDMLEIIKNQPHIKDELRLEQTPKFLEEHQIKLLKKLEEQTKQKLLTPPKFLLNEKINISPAGSERGIIVSKEVVNGETHLIVKRENGETVTINESNARKLDAVQEITVDINKDGNLDIQPKDIKDVDAPETGSKSEKVSFKENNDFSMDIVEIVKLNDATAKKFKLSGKEGEIVNKDGTPYKSTINQAFNDINRGDKRKVISEDGIVSSDGHLLVRNEFYPKIEKEFNKKNKKGEAVWEIKAKYKTANELISKAFKGLTSKYKRISIIFAGKKGETGDFNVDILVGRIGNQFTMFSRKAYNHLIKFNENGKEKTAKLVAQTGDRPLVFLHPETNKVLALLMPMKLEKGSEIYNQVENYWANYADKGNSGNFHYSKRTRESGDAGIPNDPYTGNEVQLYNSDPWYRLFENGRSIDYYGLVTLVESLLGALPKLKNLNNARYIGVFKHAEPQNKNLPLKNQAEIIVKRSLQDNPADFLKTLAHELGHLIDFVPERSMAKGNILGHIANLKKYLVHWIDGRNDGAKPLSKIEISNFKKRAEKIAKDNEKNIDIEIKELKITPETVLKIFTDAKAREIIDKEFYEAFAKLSDALKKDVVKDAMKGLMSHHLKALADKINGVKVDPKLSKEANIVFKELFEKEIKERGLVHVEVIRKELKELSAKWHPWDREIAPKSHIKYRDSASELMAEFMMAWLLSPKWARLNAPRSFDLWMHHIRSRPEIKNLYTQIQHQINSPKEVRDSIVYKEVLTNWDIGQKKGEELLKKNVEKYKVNLDDLGTEVIDTFWWILKQSGLDGQRGNSVFSKDLKYFIDLYRYRAGELSQYMRDIKSNILKDLETTAYNEGQLGYMLTLMNLAKSKQREGKITWKFFPMKEGDKVLFQKYEGDIVGMFERYASQHPELLKIARKFLYIRRTQVTRMILESKIFSAKQKKFIKENPYYITFQPLEKLFERLNFKGKYGWANKHVKQTQGTFEMFDNPYLSTVSKDLLILAEIKRQNAFHAIVTFLQANNVRISKELGWDVIYKPKYVAKGILENIKDSKSTKRIYYYRNGKQHVFDIEKKTAEAMEGNPLYSWWSVSKLASINTVYRGLFTEHQPLFWIWNWGFRDFRRSFLLLPNGKKLKTGKSTHLKTRIKYIAEVFKAFKPAIKDIYGNGTEVTRFMNKNGFLIAPEEGYRSEAGMKRHKLQLDEDSMMLKRLIYKEEANGRFQKLHEKTTQKYLLHSGRIARILERTHKIGYFETVKDMIEKKEIDMTMKELMHEIQNKAGSPNYLRQGKANPILNQMLLFFNANKEGIRGDIEAWLANKKDVTKNFLLWSVMPKVAEKIILYGGFGMALATLYQAVPDHDRDNFNVVVIGETDDGRPIYIRLPMDFNSQTAVSLFSIGFDMAFGLNKHLNWDEKLDIFFKQMSQSIPSQTPFFSMIYDALSMISGNNPLNRWGQPSLDSSISSLDLFERNGAKAKEVLKYLWNTNGGNMIYKFDKKFDTKTKIEKEYSRLTGFPIIDPLFSRFVKIGEDARIKKYHEISHMEKNAEAKVQYDLKTAIDKLVDSKEPLSNQEKFALQYSHNLADNTYLIEKLATSGDGIELLKDLLGANSKELAILIKAINEIRLQKR